MNQYVYINESAISVFVFKNGVQSQIYNESNDEIISSLTVPVEGIVKLHKENEKELEYSDTTILKKVVLAEEDIIDRVDINTKVFDFSNNLYVPDFTQYELHFEQAKSINKNEILLVNYLDELENSLSDSDFHIEKYLESTKNLANKNSENIDKDSSTKEKKFSAFYYTDDMMSLWGCGKNQIPTFINNGKMPKPHRHKKGEKKRWLKSVVDNFLSKN